MTTEGKPDEMTESEWYLKLAQGYRANGMPTAATAIERLTDENARLAKDLAEASELCVALRASESSLNRAFTDEIPKRRAAETALVAMEQAKNEYATLAHERGKEVERLRAALQRLDPALGTS